MMQASFVSASNIHSRPFANGCKALKYLYTGSGIIVFVLLHYFKYPFLIDFFFGIICLFFNCYRHGNTSIPRILIPGDEAGITFRAQTESNLFGLKMIENCYQMAGSQSYFIYFHGYFRTYLLIGLACFLSLIIQKDVIVKNLE